jgi:tyrosyl-tRNA synthetase
MNIIEELEWRGLLADCTDRPALTERLAKGPVALYCGFDPTADSLHVGNLVPLLALRRFQMCGHHPIALAGGATGMVGDPSGKSAERNLLTGGELSHNIACIKEQLTRFLDFDAPANPALLVNNADWIAPMSFLGFLRDVGKHITVNQMVAKDSVRSRMEDRESGISYTEFSYMLLQAYDFCHLRETCNCELQVGATDQWGNITVGTELTRKKLGATIPQVSSASAGSASCLSSAWRCLLCRKAHIPWPGPRSPKHMGENGAKASGAHIATASDTNPTDTLTMWWPLSAFSSNVSSAVSPSA